MNEDENERKVLVTVVWNDERVTEDDDERVKVEVGSRVRSRTIQIGKFQISSASVAVPLLRLPLSREPYSTPAVDVNVNVNVDPYPSLSLL